VWFSARPGFPKGDAEFGLGRRRKHGARHGLRAALRVKTRREKLRAPHLVSLEARPQSVFWRGDRQSCRCLLIEIQQHKSLTRLYPNLTRPIPRAGLHWTSRPCAHNAASPIAARLRRGTSGANRQAAVRAGTLARDIRGQLPFARIDRACEPRRGRRRASACAGGAYRPRRA